MVISNRNEKEQVENMMELADNIQLYFTVFTMPIGIVLNIITLIIFNRERLNRKTNIGFLYVALCLFNIAALINQILVHSLQYYGIDLTSLSSVSCKLLSLWNSFILQCPSFQLIVISTDVYASICYSHLSRSLLNRKFYLIAIVLMIFALLIANSIYLSFYMEYEFNMTGLQIQNKSSENTTEIVQFCSNSNVLDALSDLVNILMRDLIPFFVILTLNLLSIRALIKSKKILKTTGSFKREMNFIRSVLFMNFLFLIIYLPWSVSFVLYHTFHFISHMKLNLNLATFNIFQAVCNCIAYLNNYSPFLVNLSFNALFRKEFLQIVKVKIPTRISNLSNS